MIAKGQAPALVLAPLPLFRSDGSAIRGAEGDTKGTRPMTHLWVRAEQRPNEERVGLTPEGAAALVKAGVRIATARPL
jgi:hypothetical protein